MSDGEPSPNNMTMRETINKGVPRGHCPTAQLQVLSFLVAAIHLDVVHAPVGQGLGVLLKVILKTHQPLAGLCANVSIGSKLQAAMMDVLTLHTSQGGCSNDGQLLCHDHREVGEAPMKFSRNRETS